MIIFPIKHTTNLGNWMFQYAAALSYGEEVAIWPEHPEFVEKVRRYAELFSEIRVLETIPEGVVHYHQPVFGYSPLPRKTAKDLMIWGYYQSEKFFADAQQIRQIFRVSATREAVLRLRYGEWLSKPNVTGISVRRGDYMRKPQHHPFVGKQFFRDAISKLPECKDFIVCSDDLPWCKRFFPRAFPTKNFLFVEGEDVLNQLYIHTLCQNNIISNSSFSWWGAWLNENPKKRVLAPSLWFGFALYRDPRSWQDIYFRGVERVHNQYTFTQVLLAYWNVLYWTVRFALGRLKRKVWR